MMNPFNCDLLIHTNLKQQNGLFTTGFRNAFRSPIIIIFTMLLSDLITQVYAKLCFTADIRESQLQLICRFDTYVYPPSIRGPSGMIFASCDIFNTNLVCRLAQPNGKISLNYDNKTVTLIIPYERGSMFDGKWTCDDGKVTKEMSISYLEGSMKWTDVDIQGEVVIMNGKRRISISCSTCENPEGKFVEFLINNTTNDYVRYVSMTKCYHNIGICRPQDCMCSVSGNNFTHLFDIQSNSSEQTMYTCIMHFSDRYLHRDFTIHAALQFINGDFRQLETRKKVTRWSKNVSDILTTDPSGVFSSTIPLHEDHNTTEVNWRFALICAGLSLFIGLLFCGICVYLRNSQRSKNKNDPETSRDQDEEQTLLKMNDTYCDQLLTEKMEEINLVKLNRLKMIGMEVARACFNKHVLQNDDLQKYLTKKKHPLFHALHPERRCCKCPYETIDNDRPVLLKSQFFSIYESSDQGQQCGFDNKAQSICKLTPKKGILKENLDLSLLIGILSVNSTEIGTRAILEHLIKFQTLSNELIQFIGTSKLPTEQFESKWDAIKDLIMSLASNLDSHTKENVRSEIRSLYGEKTEKNEDEFSEIISQWQNALDLLSQQQEESRFQKATKNYGGLRRSQYRRQLSSGKVKVLVDKLEIHLPTFEDEFQKYHTSKGEQFIEAIIEVGLPISWDLDAILSNVHGKIEDIKTRSRIKVVAKTMEDFFLVTNIPEDIFSSKPGFNSELTKFVKVIIDVSGIDASCPAIIQIGVQFPKLWPVMKFIDL